MDSVQKTHQTARVLSHEISKIYYGHQMAGQNYKQRCLVQVKSIILWTQLHWTGHVIQWTALIYHISCSMESTYSVIGTRAAHRGGTRTVSKSTHIVSLQKSWNLVPSTKEPDIPWWRVDSLILSPAVEIESLLSEKDKRPQLLFKI